MAEGHGFSRATSSPPTLRILSGIPQYHRGASTKDQASRVAKLPTTAFSLSILNKEHKVSPLRVRHVKSWRSAALKCGT